MNLDSVRAFKAEVADQVREAPESFFDSLELRHSVYLAEQFRNATERPMPVDLALGVSKGRRRAYRVAIRTSDPELAEKVAKRAPGEADVRVLTVEARVKPEYLQGRVRPIEAGVSIGPASQSWAGTLGAFVQDSRALYALSNQHVVGRPEEVPMHEPIVQPARIDKRVSAPNVIGVADRYVPFSHTAPNLVDARLVRLADVRVLGNFNGALQRPVAGVKAIGPEDLGQGVMKIGRTTGVRLGRITSVEMDGLPVRMGDHVLRFNDQVEVSGGPATDFSAGGDSGSLIVLSGSLMAVGLLFAGGQDQHGEDFTYANLLPLVLEALGVRLVIQ